MRHARDVVVVVELGQIAVLQRAFFGENRENGKNSTLSRYIGSGSLSILFDPATLHRKAGDGKN
ncbi:hypothetical protein [Massilia antarctica]|uniref:hypothetical protein n=1 Tax=Massilia antarctica TaxID=2765360 RepID=UPI0009EC29D9|nr:hypothetical protein [Massilia sp. H27-R4]MCY0914813.1 hypothetical protein [Massilia sp. H27-R4]